MSLQAIQTALNTVLDAFATTNGVEVSWPNRGFPDGKRNYLMPTILPAGSSGVGVENTSTEDYVGLYQISIFQYKDNTGDYFSRDMATKLTQAFSRGTILDAGQLVIERCYVSSEISYDENYMLTPVTVDYRGFYK